jgi:hypothetical protein
VDGADEGGATVLPAGGVDEPEADAGFEAVVDGDADAGAGAVYRRVSPALPVTILLKMSLLLGEKTYLMLPTAIATNIKAAHILLNAMHESKKNKHSLPDCF